MKPIGPPPERDDRRVAQRLATLGRPEANLGDVDPLNEEGR
jgi:hypothetical protein